MKDKNELVKVSAYLFAKDVVTLKRAAEAQGSKWQVELRQLVRRALKGERRDLLVIR